MAQPEIKLTPILLNRIRGHRDGTGARDNIPYSLDPVANALMTAAADIDRRMVERAHLISTWESLIDGAKGEVMRLDTELEAILGALPANATAAQ